MENNKDKTLGWGSLSLILFVLAVLDYYWAIEGKELGSYILDYLNFNISAMYPTLILLVVAFLISKKFNFDLFSKTGNRLSKILLSLIVITWILSFIL